MFFCIDFQFLGPYYMTVKKNCEKICTGVPQGGSIFSSAFFWIFKNHVLASRPPKMTADKKVMKKNLSLDEIYLERGLRFKLQPQIGALEPKNPFLAFSLIYGIPSCHQQFQVLQGVIFWGMQIKNPSQPCPKNLFRCPELKKSVNNAYLVI